MSNGRFTRRTFLSRGAATGGVVVLGSAAPALLAGCSSGSSSGTYTGTPGVGSGTPRRGGSVTFGMTADIDGFLPSANHWDNNGRSYANTVYDSLTAVAADGSVKPYLAQSVTPNADLSVWTVTLRPGITFHDGSALTSSVVKANFDAIKASPLTGSAVSVVSSVAVPDPMTVVFTCDEPVVAFPAYLATQVGYVVGTAMLDAAKSSSKPPTPVGTGPFVYADWQPNDHFTATRNPHYWRTGFPYLDQVTYRPIPDTTQREATLKTGGVDLIVSIDPNTIDHFTGQSGYQVVDTLHDTVGEPSMDFIMLNCATAPTNDLRIRQALAKGLDQATIQKIFGGGFAQPANGLFPKGSPYYSDTGFPTYDPAGARTLVAAYKQEHGTPHVQLTTIPDPRLARLIQIVQQMWQQVGFVVSLQTVEQANLILNAVTGNFQAYTFENFAAPDPDLNYVWLSTTTVAPPPQLSLNFPRNSDPQIQAALQTGRTSSDPATRIAAYRTVNERLAVDLPYLWLSRTPWSEVGDARIRNFANPVLPDGTPGKRFDNGIVVPTQIWVDG